jgi:hypothetical protein
MFPNIEGKEVFPMKQKSKCMKGMTIGMAVVLIFFCAGVTGLHSGACESAFLRCSSDPYWQAVAFGVVYCVTGYVFCKKYIEG